MALQDLPADFGVPLHDREFVVVELAGFEQHRIRNTDLADVVHRRGFKEDQVGNVVGMLGQRLRQRVESQRRAAFEAALQYFGHL